ncbi:MAG: molybdopterin-dependent oxidoreductase [Chloroflexi bacterium]|nr:molybdopterin-dependent oxidoreductase [Chloroflexota bacterium]
MALDQASSTGAASAPDTKLTTCYMCTTGFCLTDVTFAEGRPVKAAPRGVPCIRGQAQVDFAMHPDRLQYPLRRTSARGEGKFERISWDEALDTIAAAILKVKREYGPESVVFYSGYTKEPRPYWQRLAHAFGSPNFLTESSSCYSATYVAAYLSYGKEYASFTRGAGLDPQSKLYLVWASNPPISGPPSLKPILAARKAGVKIVVVDPRRTEMAQMADLHVQPRPGSDGALALGMMHVLIGQGLYDREFVGKWTVGFEDLRKLVAEYTPEKVEQITWVPADKVRELALIYAANSPAKIHLSACGTVHTSNGVSNYRAISLLPALTGNLDVPGGNRPYPKGVPSNDISLFEERIGQLPPRIGAARFPVWTKIYHEGHANALADQIESGEPYPIKALVGIGANVMIWPNTARMAEALKSLDFLAFSDYFHTPTTFLGDIVIPAATFFENPALLYPSPFTAKAGTVRLREPIIDPIGESWPDWKFTFKLAEKLGLEHEFWGGDIEKCFNTILEPSELTIGDLRENPEGIKFEQPVLEPRRYEKTGFQTPSGKVEIVSSILVEHGYEGLPAYVEPSESPIRTPELAKSYPLVLMTGARIAQFTHTCFRTVKKLRDVVPHPQVDINPRDASARGIHDGDDVLIETPRGQVKFKARVTDSILSGVVSASHGWAEANVNLLIDDKGLDPISGFPPYKAQLCQVTRAS